MVVGMLVSLQVCTMQFVKDMVAVMRTYAVGTSEFDFSQEIVDKEYGEFITAVEQNSS